MIDNYNLISPFLRFESKDDFYYLQILQRRKENPNCASNTRSIKEYFICSLAYLYMHYEEIKSLCNQFNARAYIRLNKRSATKVCYKTLEIITAQMMQNNHMFACKAYSHAAGQCHHDPIKKWIVDIDVKDERKVDELRTFIDSLLPFGNKILITLPTKSGYHMISTPFNMKDFSVRYPEISVHKDNPTVLFVP